MKFKKLDPEAILPKYEHKGDSGFDLHSIGFYTVNYGKVVMVHTARIKKAMRE